MRLIVYYPLGLGIGSSYECLLHCPGWEGGKEILDSLEALAERLRSPRQQGLAVVLVLESPEALARVLQFSELLSNLELAVVLPARDITLEGQAHALRPRFLTYLDQDPGELLTVLGNISKRLLAQQAREDWGGAESAGPRAGQMAAARQARGGRMVDRPMPGI